MQAIDLRDLPVLFNLVNKTGNAFPPLILIIFVEKSWNFLKSLIKYKYDYYFYYQ